MRRLLAPLVVVLVGVLGVVLPSSATASAPSPVQQRSCAWALAVDPALINVLFPDEAAHYWVLALPLLPGESLTLHGRYPHSRYFSFTSYDPTLRSADGIHDTEITPDPGSTDPFRVGAARTARSRAYTVHVVAGARPKKAAANTLYTGSADGSRSNPALATVIYRDYRQDRGLGDDGGVGLPSVTVNTPLGAVPVPQCPLATVPPNTINQTLADASLTSALPPVVGTSTPQWRKFYNLPTSVGYALTTPFTGEKIGDALSPITTSTPKGGFADNPDNTYISTELSSSHGQVAVITGRMPTYPSTYAGQRTMAGGELRYWSMCSEEFATTRYYGCVNDDEVPLTKGRRFTIMVSTAAQRPTNAKDSCGIAWLPAGPLPDTILIERNMLPSASFTHAIQNARPGHERSDLGAYYPSTRYVTTQQAEKIGCRRSTP